VTSTVATAVTRAGRPVPEAYQEHAAIPGRSSPFCQSGDPSAASLGMRVGYTCTIQTIQVFAMEYARIPNTEGEAEPQGDQENTF